MNGSLHRLTTPHDTLLQNFIKENNISVQNYPEKPTFYHHNGRSRGQIYYIFMIDDGASAIKVDILDIDPLNCSDHIPASIPCQWTRKLKNQKL